jgi:5-methylthioribose kinase
MRDFTSYFLMKAKDAGVYAGEKLSFFSAGADLEAVEIGDGNINYVFRIREAKSGKSLILKQAGPTARLSDQFVVSQDRSRIEAEALRIENELAPGLVPLLYHYDPVMKCCAMEDLSDHTIMRTALIQGREFPLFADHITTFLVNTLLLTSDVLGSHKEKKRLVGEFINPDLCEITEDLVFTEPFNDVKGRNKPFPPNMSYIKTELYEDERLLLETARMKFQFYTSAQSLVHGDLHTGSIFVTPASTKVIDPEFSFYGPAGYDIGNVIANLIFAWVRADTTIENRDERASRTAWIAQTLVSVVELFTAKWRALWEKKATETVARYAGVADWYLGSILSDSAGVAGIELCRRIVGIAQVQDITSIEKESQRIRAERLCLAAAKRLIFERQGVTTGENYLEILSWAGNTYPR